jgi:hypothetical protein
MYRPPERNPRSTRRSSPYTLSRRNVFYYNPWTADDYVQATTPPWTNRAGPKTLEQLALRRSVQLGLPTPSILGRQRAATQFQLSFRDYMRRSERTQCVDVLRNCHGYSKKRIIQCLLEFMEYLVYGQAVDAAVPNEEIYEILRNYITLHIYIQNTRTNGNHEVYGPALYNFVERAPPGEVIIFFRKELSAVSKPDIQDIIDNTILKYISPMIYEI